MQRFQGIEFNLSLKRSIIAAMFFLYILFNLSVASAQNNTLYLIHSVPQANQLNPAIKHNCRFYLSLPVISSVRLSVRNTSFGFHDVVHSGTGAMAETYYLDVENLEKKLRPMNYSLFNTDTDLIGAGFTIKDWYLTFNISSHFSVQTSLPDDVINLKDGNWNVNAGVPVPVKLNRIGVNSTAWNSIGISGSKEIFEGFRVGARVKYLNGMANLNTKKSQIELNTIADPVTLDALVNYKVSSSLPVTLGYSSHGLVSSVDFEPATQNLISNYIFNGNRGLALDGGIVYDLDEETQLTASFTDLGFVWWRNNVNNFTGNGKFVFRGIDLDQYFNDPNQGDLLNALEDSLLHSFHASTNSKGYLTMLPVNLYGGITREFLPDLKAGAMTWIEVNGLHVRPSLTLSLNATPFKAFAASISYTIMNNKLNQLGAGLVLGNRGAQFYILTDNIPVRFTREVSSGLFWPYNARMLSLRFGLNFFFGCEEEDGGMNRRPRSPGTKMRDDCPAYW